MKSIKQQLNRVDSINNNIEQKDEPNVDEIDAFLMQETLTSSIHFLWGYYKCYCRINEIEDVTAEEFFNHVDDLPSYDDEKKRREFLKNNLENNINKFLYWYFYEG